MPRLLSATLLHLFALAASLRINGIGRRGALRSSAAIAANTALGALKPEAANAYIGKESEWPLWPALPVAPYSKRKTIRQEAGPGVWTFDQLIGIYYVQVPIRMTVIKMETGGLFVYAPVAPTPECLALLQPLIDAHGSIRYIVLPSVAVEHKVNAGPFARQFPDAEFYVVDRQYSFPVPLPSAFLGLPRWAKPLPPSSSSGAGKGLWGGEFEHEVLTVEPGPASMFQEGAFVHKPSKTLLLCDTLFSATSEPPAILQSEPEYVRALLFHARDAPLELVEDTPEARRKGWRRIVLLFNFFFPGSARVDLGIGPLVESRGFTRPYTYGWGGWQPLKWRGDDSEQKAFDTYIADGKPTVYTIVQIILARGDSGAALRRWVDVVRRWEFERVIPAHLDAPLRIGPEQFAQTFDFAREGSTVNRVRFCDEDVAFLRGAEEGFLSFSVYESVLGPLRGQKTCGL